MGGDDEGDDEDGPSDDEYLFNIPLFPSVHLPPVDRAKPCSCDAWSMLLSTTSMTVIIHVIGEGMIMGLALFLEFMARTIAYKAKHPPSKPLSLDPRYKVDRIHATSLEGNSLGSPVDRNLHVYLPPGYFESGDKRYPVIYYLHGYGASDTSTNIASAKDWYRGVRMILDTAPRTFLSRITPNSMMASYEQIDAAILAGKFPPFLLVQVDGSLHIPQITNMKEACGKPITKGGFYVNHRGGKYMDYVVKDIINYVDKTYRTIPDKQHRGIFGHSMGGYGTLYLCMHHPDLFVAASAVSPAVFSNDAFLHCTPVAPMNVMIAGKKIAYSGVTRFRAEMQDTIRMLFWKDIDMPVDENGCLIEIPDAAIKAYDPYHGVSLIKRKGNVFNEVALDLYCHENDEYGLASTTREMHEILKAAGIEHACEISTDPVEALSPHGLGGFQHFEAAIKHICKHFVD